MWDHCKHAFLGHVEGAASYSGRAFSPHFLCSLVVANILAFIRAEVSIKLQVSCGGS